MSQGSRIPTRQQVLKQTISSPYPIYPSETAEVMWSRVQLLVIIIATHAKYST